MLVLFKNKIKLSSTDINEYSRETPLGIVQTNKVVQVNNERNTKYTFKVSSPTNANSVINLIVVDMGGDIIEYFIQYIFDPNNPSPRLPSGAIDMSRFTGGMTFYNMEGVIIGNFILTDGDLVDFDGEIDPCPEDDVVEEEDETDDSSNSNSGGGATNDTDPDSNNDNDDSSDGSTSGGGSGEVEDPDRPCGFEITYQPCACGGSANGHGASECGCDTGSPTTITNTCNGDSVTYYNSRTIMGATSPCDGDVGVLLPLDDCEVSNESFNSGYSVNSPFNVDLSNVREDCNATVGIDTSLVSANAKFICIYNKLVNSPNFKNLFVDTFGESEEFNVKFEITDTLDEETLGTTSGNVISQGDDVLEINQVIKLNKGMFDSSSNIQKTPIEIAIVIIHESIHAFLNIKKYNCDNGSSIEELNNMLLHELLNEFFDGSCIPEQEQHEFMFNYLLPTMEQILQDIKDDTIPLNQQEFLNYVNFYNELDENNPLDESHPFDFNELFHYLSMVGLQETQSMIDNFNNNPIDEYLYGEYRTQANTLSKNCYN